MLRSLSPLVVLFLLGCPTTVTCPAGTRFMFGVCVEQDGGPDAPAPDVPEIDAGPCGEDCTLRSLLCDETSGTCVECLSPTDCEAPDLACIGGMREQCETNAECTTADLSVCNTTTHVCEACDGDEDCGHDGLPGACDTSAPSPTCVECTQVNEDACVGNVCDVDAHTCTSVPAGSVDDCQPCTSDRACMPGLACVLQRFDEPPVDGTLIDIGYFCLPMGPTCPLSGAPFISAASLSNRAGDPTPVCDLRLATCPAYRALGTACTTGDDCGATDVDDGVCETDPVDSTLHCTTRCTGADARDCDSGLGCSGSSPRYCCFGPSC